jgi:hypothetical protein
VNAALHAQKMIVELLAADVPEKLYRRTRTRTLETRAHGRWRLPRAAVRPDIPHPQGQSRRLHPVHALREAHAARNRSTM